MPLEPFDTMPSEARVWVFGADRPLAGDDAKRLLAEVDGYLERWKAHGTPLHCARDWRENRFLTVAVDTTREGASGCSIDGLFRTLQTLESQLDAALVGGGRIFYRDASGAVRCVERADFPALARDGMVTDSTPVFDPTVTTMADWRARFETRVKESWHAALVR